MALDKTTLISSIESALVAAHGQTKTAQDTAFATALGNAIDNYVGTHDHAISSGSSAPGPTGPPL